MVVTESESKSVTAHGIFNNIYLSKEVENGVVFDFWTEEELPFGRELQSMRRVSEALAQIDCSVVVGKSHVLISA